MQIKTKIIITTLIFLSIFSSVWAQDKILILDYKKYDNIDFNWIANVSTSNPSLARIINDTENKKIYLEIVDKINEVNIDIKFKYNWKSRTFSYKHVPKFKENVDIWDKIKIKRIQKKPLSCELSVASDIITYLDWVDVTEDDVLSIIDKTFLNKLPFIYHWLTFWWNPNKWFVWYIDYYWEGKKIKPTQRNMTGYWVYEKPISEVYNYFWLQNKIITIDDYYESFSEKEHLSLLLKNVERGNMVQLWGDWCTLEKYDDWKIGKIDMSQEKADNKIYAKNYCQTTLDDRKIEWNYIENFKFKKFTGLIGEHAFYLLWYEWWVNNPKKIIVWDSDTWYHKYDTVEWMRKWKLMDYKSIIINKP